MSAGYVIVTLRGRRGRRASVRLSLEDLRDELRRARAGRSRMSENDAQALLTFAEELRSRSSSTAAPKNDVDEVLVDDRIDDWPGP